MKYTETFVQNKLKQIEKLKKELTTCKSIILLYENAFQFLEPKK